MKHTDTGGTTEITVLEHRTVKYLIFIACSQGVDTQIERPSSDAIEKNKSTASVQCTTVLQGANNLYNSY